ncbi:translational GTPase TypA [Fluviispira multicolorata]|uniref:50S ribosomal subunit assembly factor BipA n=1 Tax=Fluviispira multicolorata TaxID=2654512 RepID=A0A833JDQ8_9BACT|nr:translational GTPase TypA [Fluviispira multicolorata]KAB8032010.1 translational GTPase TypA [Fluviispira multicolorata]
MTTINGNMRNIAIIAHVDHGKTTLVDKLLQQSGTFAAHQSIAERVMDSMDLERERGITIAAKNASMMYKDVRINIVDTPGHADFGGEVERTLMMVDGAILLVDAAEGPLPQTRFVLQKALQRNLRMILVINKVDRSDARVDEVSEMVQDLFLELSSEDHHLDFPILYASGRNGWASKSKDIKTDNLQDLFDTVLEHVPPPRVQLEGGAQFLINNLSYNNFLGRLAIGRIERGTLTANQNIVLINKEGKQQQAKIIKVRAYRGLEQTDVESVSAGDIAILATGLNDLAIGDTIADATNPEALPRIEVDPPTVGVEVSVNTSPMAGREGTYLTSSKLGEFLLKEAMNNVALKIENTDSPEVFILKARGELQVAIVMENLRRAGGECMVARPKVITKKEKGETLEPVERVVLDVPDASVGSVTEKLSIRKGRLENMQAFNNGRTRIEFSIPTRGLLGYRSTFLTDTKGEGLMSSYFEGWETNRGSFLSRVNGALVADRSGKTTEYALSGLEERGRLFVGAGEEVYEGMIVGEHNRDSNLDVNAVREKKLTNMRASGSDDSTKLSPVTRMSLETALDWVEDDDWIEITPKNIRIRKRTLASNQRSVSRREKGE